MTSVKLVGRLVIGLSVGLVACAQLLGVDDLRDRAAASPDAGGQDSGAEGAAPLECTTNAECMAKKEGEGAAGGWVCARGTCAPLRLYDEKNQVVCFQNAFPSNDLLKDDDVILVAAFVGLSTTTFDSQPVMKAYRLALEELRPENAGTGWPKVAMMVCASDEKDGRVDKGVNHVVDDLHVPIILAGFDAPRLSTIVAEKTVDAGIFVMNPSAPSEELKFKPVGNLVLNLLGAPSDVALAYRPLLQAIEPRVRAARDVAHRDDPVKVALIVTGNTSTEADMSTTIQQGSRDAFGNRDASTGIVFNDAGALANMPNPAITCAPNASFCSLEIDALENGKTPNYAKIKSDLLAFRPDVVIALTRGEIGPIVACHERTLVGLDQPGDPCSPSTGFFGAMPNPTADAGVTLPYWLLGPGNAQDVLDFLAPPQANGTAHADFREVQKRFFGIQYAGAADTLQRSLWLQRMQAMWQAADLPNYQSTENYYDAVYWLAYGLVAARPDHPTKDETTGQALSFGVRRMFGPAGPTVIPGPDGLKTAAVPLSVGNVRFEGALGPADIDERFNTWNSVGGVYCYEDLYTLSSDPIALSVKFDSRRYNRADGGLDKVADCFGNQP
jgi:hypothetical protein